MADEYELTGNENVWIICDEILKNPELALLRNGFLIAQYIEEIELLYSSLAIIKKSFESYNSSIIMDKPGANCSENSKEWHSGKFFFE